MVVFVLFHETNTGSSDESDGYVEGVFLTEALAEAAMRAMIRRAIANGEDVYWNPDTDEDFPETWAHDWHVEAHTVREDADIEDWASLYGWAAPTTTQRVLAISVLASWQNHPSGLQEEVREYQASSLAEALTMAERQDAGKPYPPTCYGVLPEDFDRARAEGIEFNEADGLLVGNWS